MGKSLSVIKSNRQSERKRQLNLLYKDNVRRLRKKIRKMVEKKEDHQAIMEIYKEYASAVDKAGKKHIFHKNNVARKKSRINQMIKKYAQAS